MRLPCVHGRLGDGVVLLRGWRGADAACVLASMAEPDIPHFMTAGRGHDLERAAAWIDDQERRNDAGQALSLAIADAHDGRAVGSITLTPRLAHQEGAAGLGWWLLPAARGAGLATRAARLVIGWALGEGGVARVEALVEPGNAASLRVARAVGLVEEGLLRGYVATPDGRRLDVIVLARLAGDGG